MIFKNDIPVLMRFDVSISTWGSKKRTSSDVDLPPPKPPAVNVPLTTALPRAAAEATPRVATRPTSTLCVTSLVVRCRSPGGEKSLPSCS